MEQLKKTELLNIQPNVLNILPRDFVIMYKTLPISYDAKTFVVGMVNPNDKIAIENIIFFTQLKPQILPITEEDFLMCIKKFYPPKNEKRKSIYIQKK